MKFKLCNKNYYREKEKLFDKNELQLDLNNIYALVGCNGSGKSTILTQICQDIETSPGEHAYDLLVDYSGYAHIKKLFKNDYDSGKNNYDIFYLHVDKEARGWDFNDFESPLFTKFQSCGEQLIYNMTPCLSIVLKELDRLKNKTLILLLDDLDVGVSLDVILEEKAIIKNFKTKLEANNTNFIIVICANNWELAKDYICIDCNKLERIKFKNYDDYLKYILKTRKYKDKRNKIK